MSEQALRKALGALASAWKTERYGKFYALKLESVIASNMSELQAALAASEPTKEVMPKMQTFHPTGCTCDQCSSKQQPGGASGEQTREVQAPRQTAEFDVIEIENATRNGLWEYVKTCFERHLGPIADDGSTFEDWLRALAAGRAASGAQRKQVINVSDLLTIFAGSSVSEWNNRHLQSAADQLNIIAAPATASLSEEQVTRALIEGYSEWMGSIYTGSPSETMKELFRNGSKKVCVLLRSQPVKEAK